RGTEAGGVLEDATAARFERARPGGDHARQLLGEPDGAEVAECGQIAATTAERTVLHQVVQQLLDEERVAARRGAHGRDQLVRRLAQPQAADQTIDLRLVEPRDVETECDVLAAQTSDGPLEAAGCVARPGPAHEEYGDR